MDDITAIRFAEYILSERLALGSKNNAAWLPITKTDLNRFKKFSTSQISKKK